MKSAYPYIHRHPTSGITELDDGMTLRDYFAGQVLPRLMGTGDIQECVKSAYKWADAMLEQRENKDE
jgi:hypothetical protein